LEALVTSIRQLYVGIRGARTALWATLTCTILGAAQEAAAAQAKEEVEEE
jgi:hypothetical protein